MRGRAGTLLQWTDRVVSLAHAGTAGLATRIVFVPRMEIATLLRQEIIRRGEDRVLVGTRFARPVEIAEEILLDRAIRFRTGEDRRRATRLASLFGNSALPLEYFDSDLLRFAPGWPEAFAETITDLEENGWTPRSLAAACPGSVEFSRVRDVASIWLALEEAAATSWSEARILAESTPHVNASSWDEALALLGGSESVVERRFLEAVPGIRLCGLADRRDDRTAGRRSELSRLASEIFQTHPTIERGPSADGSVHLEEHGGLADEVQAAAAWAVHRITEGDRLDEIGILVPALDPYATLLATEFDGLPGDIALHVSGGIAAIATPEGAAVANVLQALEEGLSPRGLVDVLRRLTGHDGTVLSRDRAVTLVNAVTLSGEPSGDVPRWSERARALAARIATTGHTGDHALTGPRGEHEREDARRLLDLLTVRDALLERLDQWLVLTRNGAPLDRIAQETTNLLETSLADGSRSVLIPALRAALEDIAEIPLTGLAAVRAIRASLARIRLPFGSAGMPAIRVGTIADSIGRSFRSLRIVGLAEGGFPHVAREDPVLPDALRLRLSPELERGAKLVERDIRAFADVIRGCTTELRLSTARVNADGSAHEPSPILLDTARALRRQEAAIPDLRSLRAEYFASGAGALRRDLAYLGALCRPSPSPLDADLSAGAHPILRDEVPLPGLDSSRPIAASGLRLLLTCPHRFLLEQVLHWRAPAEMPGARDIAPMEYGRAFHEHVEAFFIEHGLAFARRDRDLAAWQSEARRSLRASDSIRPRLERDLAAFLAYDWQRAPSRFVAVERPFGYEAPVRIAGLYVHGSIDRIDEETDTIAVRDLKTGRARRRSGLDPSPGPQDDLQLALYALVARACAPAWGLPSRLTAAYVHVSDGVVEERAFRESTAVGALLDAGAEWLAITRALLESRMFPRTPDPHDCARCPFEPACGPDAAADSAARLASEGGAGSEFLELRSRAAGART